MPRKTRCLTLQLPPEFVALCESDGVTPEQVLRGFIADLAGIMNWAADPRADGYSSNGSDERDHAESYIERAWGHMREEAEQAQRSREEAQEYEDECGEALDRLRVVAERKGLNLPKLFDLIEKHFDDAGAA